MSFILKNSKADRSLIILSYKRGLTAPFRYSTGQVTETKNWNKKNHRVDGKNTINSELERYDKFLTKCLELARINETEITKEYLFNEFEKEFSIKPKQKRVTHTFYEMIDGFIERSKTGHRTTKRGTKITGRRIGHYETFIKNLKDYAPDLSVKQIDLNFYRGYVAHRNSKGKTLNTVGKEINILKVILRETFKQGLHTNRIFEHDDFRTFKEDSENVFLNDTELDILWNKTTLNDLPLSDKLTLVRDVFIVGCYTGLRISDLGVLEKYNIVDGMLKIIPEKTDEPVYIPIHPRVQTIINKYGGFPRSYSDQKMNDYLKELCKEDFKDKAVYKRTEGGEVKRHVKEKWQRITNHTARRSFATNLYLAGFDTISIMKITGHKSEKSFMRYICVSQRQMAQKMAEHPYFK